MRKLKAVALALPKNHPVHAVLDFMYGTPERTQLTLAFAVALLALAAVLDASPLFASSVCPV